MDVLAEGCQRLPLVEMKCSQSMDEMAAVMAV